MQVRVKMCGLRTPVDIENAHRAGATYAGLVFFATSPRNVTFDQACATALAAPVGMARVALTVDADDAALDAIMARVPIDMVQLHGRETPARVAAVRARYGLPVMKAVGVAVADDLAILDTFGAVADQILVDAKPPAGSGLPGGNGLAFDWRLLAGRRWRGPWMLAGGLTAANVAQAVRLTGATQVDVSSGVESAPGIKDAAQMAAFVAAAKGKQHA